MKDLEATMAQKEQVTIPAAMWVRLSLQPKARVRIEVDGDDVKLRSAKLNLLAGFGAVTPLQRPEDWHEVESVVQQMIGTDAAGED